MQAESSQKPIWSIQRGQAPLAPSSSHPAAALFNKDTRRVTTSLEDRLYVCKVDGECQTVPGRTFQDVLCSLDASQGGRAVHKVYDGAALQQGLTCNNTLLGWPRRHRHDFKPLCSHTHESGLRGPKHSDGSVHVVVSLVPPQRQAGRHVQIGADVSTWGGKGKLVSLQ